MHSRRDDFAATECLQCENNDVIEHEADNRASR
jgi:hypothetical protein